MNETANDLLLVTFAGIGLLFGLTLFGEILRSRVPEGQGSRLVETYMTRVHSWWGMVLLLSFALLLGRLGAIVLFAFASFAALREFLTLTSKSQADHMALALAFYAFLPLQFFFVWIGWTYLFSLFIPVYAFLLLPAVSALRGDPKRFLVRVAETQWALMICVYCVSHVPALLTLRFDGYAGREILLIAFLVMVVQLGDLLDFYFGRRIGRRRIAPNLSPKTWEGAIAGVLSAALIGGLFAWLTPFGVAGAALMAGIASVAGMFGNLVLAAIKRDRGVKDWSHLIPGQGGFMEQMDSVVFAAPIFFHLTAVYWASP